MYPRFLIYCIFTSLLFGCKQSQVNSKVDKGQAASIVLESKALSVDNDFNEFIQQFSKDSLFQISRIHFPLNVQEYDVMNDVDIAKTINKQDFRKLDFTIRKSDGETDSWEQGINVRDNKAIIEIQGIDNGIIVDFYFEKQDGKWYLVKWVDSST